MEYFFPLPSVLPSSPPLLSLISLAHRVASRRIIIAIFSWPLGKFCRSHCEQTIRPYSLPRSPCFFKFLLPPPPLPFPFSPLDQPSSPNLFPPSSSILHRAKIFPRARSRIQKFSPDEFTYSIQSLCSFFLNLFRQRGTTRFLERSANFPCFRWFIKHRDRVGTSSSKNFVIRRVSFPLFPSSSDTSIRFRRFKVATFACAPESNQKTKQISKGCASSAA